MHLLDLPNEILIEIFIYVDTSFFRSDLSRLTICKQWHEIARTVCFQDLHLTPETLRRLSFPSYLQSSLALLRNNLKTLDLELKGFGSCSKSEPRDDREFAIWKTKLQQDLLCLADLMGASLNLRTLYFQATNEWEAPRLIRRDYLYLSTIRTLLEVKNLTNLELDLGGSQLLPLVHTELSGPHICTTISTLLTSLQRLRLRMHRVCGAVLKLPEHCTDLRLNEVIINLGLPYDSPFITMSPHATDCNYPGVAPWSRDEKLRLQDNLKEQAHTLVTQMAVPKMVRILTHAPTHCEMYALDVLTDTYLELREDAEWDDAGEVLVESDDEAEVSDPNSDEGKLQGVFRAELGSGSGS